METPKDSPVSSEPGAKQKEAPKYVNVAAAIIEQNGKFLVGRRKIGKQYGGKWALVGGKFEAGESAEEALRREVKEELDIDVEIIRPFTVKEHTYPNGDSFRVHYFICRIVAEPRNITGHDELRWVTPGEFQELDSLETDKAIFSSLQANEKPGN